MIIWMFYEASFFIDNDRLSGKRENIDKNTWKKQTYRYDSKGLKLT